MEKGTLDNGKLREVGWSMIWAGMEQMRQNLLFACEIGKKAVGMGMVVTHMQ